MTKWEGKNVTVFGLGKSGIAVLRKLKPLAARLFATDSGDSPDPKNMEEARALGAMVETGGHTEKCLENTGLIVLSPGVRTDLPILGRAREKGIPVIAEIELAFRFFSKPIIAVTGTNGKTTTATLIGEFLKAAGRKVEVAGNIGHPLVLVDDASLDIIVAEISSYQLENIVSFRPWISLMLNLSEDHLERHGSMDEYGRMKQRLFMNQQKTDYLVYNAEDPEVVRLVEGAQARLVPFTKKDPEQFLGIGSSEMKMEGDHNLENAMAAASAAKIAGVATEAIAKVLKEFPGVEHRIEFVREKDGVRYYNDSKATNPDSTAVAIRALGGKGRPLVLILGGRDKGGDLSRMVGEIKKSVRKVVLIGEAAGRFAKALEDAGYKEHVNAAGLKEAVRLASGGETVLLSPACASFDMFRDYEERGMAFKALVSEL